MRWLASGSLLLKAAICGRLASRSLMSATVGSQFSIDGFGSAKRPAYVAISLAGRRAKSGLCFGAVWEVCCWPAEPRPCRCQTSNASAAQHKITSAIFNFLICMDLILESSDECIIARRRGGRYLLCIDGSLPLQSKEHDPI